MANKVEEIKQAKDGLEIWPDIMKYSKTGYASIPAEDLSRLRWFGVYEQQPREGYFMMRVRIPGGYITAAQWRTLAEISRDYGRDIADITTRQNVQFHWLTPEILPDAITRLNQVGLSTLGACGDITRNIAGCPVAGLDPDELYDCRKLISDVTSAFLGNHELSNLPRKFKITISGCSHQCHQPEINDVGISAVKKPDGTVGFQVRVGGGLSTHPRFSQQLDVFLHPEQVSDFCIAVTKVFRDYGYRDRRNHARLKFLIDDWGTDKFLHTLISYLGWNPEHAAVSSEPARVYASHVGLHSQKQHGLHWIGSAVLTGRMTSSQMLQAADIAEKYCSGELRTTNQQNLLFPNIASDDLDDVKRELKEIGFVWDVSSFRRSALCCTGAEFCNLAITETKQRLHEIIAYLEEKLMWDEDIRINLNGCPNSCGQHHIGDIGLQGCLAKVNGEKVQAYDICLGGRLGRDARFTRPIERKVPADKVKYALENLLKSYLDLRDTDETFSFFLERHSNEELGEFLGTHLLAEPDPDFVPSASRHVYDGELSV
jgi:precorrin-3B synthase